MFKDIITYYYKNDGFNLLCSSVCIQILSGLYKTFIKEGLAPIQSLPQEQQDRYYNAAIKHQELKSKIDQAYKAAYVLELITAK